MIKEKTIYPKITNDIVKEHGLSNDEYKLILEILGREPNYDELGVFSVMWSEHCSYKSSIKMIKTLPRSGGRLLVDAGEENAGLVDIGDNLAISFICAGLVSQHPPKIVAPSFLNFLTI